ncbi:HTH_Tnp_Tc3_2 domain-containing protein [Trichonephila clavipes]|nr:HTH_Tnp_Tc3_2 domain-containing protein [Trichonephila clavipes]
MKTAGWSTRRVAGQVISLECAVRNCWEKWTREGTHARKTGSEATRKTSRREDRRSCGKHFWTPHGTSTTASTVVPSHINGNVTDWQKIVFSEESRFVLGTDDNRIRVWRRPGERYNSPHTVLRHTARTAGVMTLPWPTCSPDLSPVEHVWDQLKRQIPSCHSVHDLELAVQDLWAHLPQDNIRCLINSMPGRVTACNAAGGGPTRY